MNNSIKWQIHDVIVTRSVLTLGWTGLQTQAHSSDKLTDG